mmetsp:Transcript_42972/g.91359  ORF Transcript_42972/g.91359 Transcript_42972/m.91359 type:complete len:255 (-) Transcript_42972:225-989(-)
MLERHGVDVAHPRQVERGRRGSTIAARDGATQRWRCSCRLGIVVRQILHKPLDTRQRHPPPRRHILHRPGAVDLRLDSRLPRPRLQALRFSQVGLRRLQQGLDLGAEGRHLLGQCLARRVEGRRGRGGGTTGRAGGGVRGRGHLPRSGSGVRGRVLHVEQGGRHGLDGGQRPAVLHHQLVDLVKGALGVVGELGVGRVAREGLLQLLLILLLLILLLRGRRSGCRCSEQASRCWCRSGGRPEQSGRCRGGCGAK